jgi:cytoskeletal protein CcmA (bactofilin family)
VALKYFNVISGVAAGNITINAGNGTVVADNVVGNINSLALTANGNVSFTGSNVSLGNVSNLKITGGSSGQYLQTDGTGNLTWAAGGGGGGTPGGSNTQVQFNESNNFAASANFTFDSATSLLTVNGNVAAGNLTTVGALSVSGTGNIGGELAAANLTVGTGTGGNITGANLISANFFTGTLTTNAQPNITSVGTLTALGANGNVSFTGSNVSLGNVSNLKITGGSSGQYLQTDGTGNLTWAAGGGNSLPWYWDPPLASSFTLISDDATDLVLTDNSDVGLTVDAGTNAGGSLRMAYRTLTDKTLSWTMVAHLHFFATNQNFVSLGLGLRDSVSDRVIRFGVDTNLGLAIIRDETLSSFDSISFSLPAVSGTILQWFRVQHVGGDLVFSMSNDGKTWRQVYSESATTWLTNRADQVGILGFGNDTSGLITCDSFQLTGPGV